MALLEADAFGCELVDVGRFDERVSVAGEAFGAEFVRDVEDEVGAIGRSALGLRDGRSGCRCPEEDTT